MKNMKLLKILIGAIAIYGTLAQAQTDEERAEIGKSYMEKVSKKNKSYNTTKASLTFTIDNKQSNSKSNHKGTLWTKGNKYKLTLMDNITFFDGTTVCTWLVKDNEANISDVDENTEEMMGPLQLTSSFDKKYKMRYIDDTKISGTDCAEIDLYPIDRKTNIVRVRLTIDKKTSTIKRIMQQGKDGTSYYVEIETFSANENIPDKEFTFDPTQHTNVEVVDLR